MATGPHVVQTCLQILLPSLHQSFAKCKQVQSTVGLCKAEKRNASCRNKASLVFGLDVKGFFFPPFYFHESKQAFDAKYWACGSHWQQ